MVLQLVYNFWVVFKLLKDLPGTSWLTSVMFDLKKQATKAVTKNSSMIKVQWAMIEGMRVWATTSEEAVFWLCDSKLWTLPFHRQVQPGNQNPLAYRPLALKLSGGECDHQSPAWVWKSTSSWLYRNPQIIHLICINMQ